MLDVTHLKRILAAVAASSLTVAGLASVTTGCTAADASVSVHGSRVDLTVRDFKIDSPQTVPSGTVTFVVHGAGPMMHELNVAWTDLAAKDLPLTSGDLVADTKDTSHFVHVGEVEGIEMGKTKSLTVQLESGKTYVLYCNMEGHYMAGMTTIVTAA